MCILFHYIAWLHQPTGHVTWQSCDVGLDSSPMGLESGTDSNTAYRQQHCIMYIDAAHSTVKGRLHAACGHTSCYAAHGHILCHVAQGKRYDTLHTGIYNVMLAAVHACSPHTQTMARGVQVVSEEGEPAGAPGLHSSLSWASGSWPAGHCTHCRCRGQLFPAAAHTGCSHLLLLVLLNFAAEICCY